LTQSVNISTLPKIDDFLQELATIQQKSSKRYAILGSRHVPLTHQYLIELLSYALVLGGNSVITSGAIGTNLAIIRGAMRANPDLLTVILPQSLNKQPYESREQLENVMHLIEHSENDKHSM
jgi:predicted Rossmann fold nucleotide-binding protein DprA/Smf involved in DNA uptake